MKKTNTNNTKTKDKSKKKTTSKPKLSDIDLKEKRIIYLDGEIDDQLAKETIETLIRLDLCNHKDITMIINSSGGSVTSGLAIYDTMTAIKSDVSTVGIGRIASMATILLINGTKGKRYIMPNAEIMIHEVSSFNYGKLAEMNDKLEHTRSLNDKLIKILANKTNRTIKQLRKDTINKDRWLTATTALEEGFVDKIYE